MIDDKVMIVAIFLIILANFLMIAQKTIVLQYFLCCIYRFYLPASQSSSRDCKEFM